MTPDVIAIIPARAGSKGIPGKNLSLLLGKPLICWTIDAALAAPCVKFVVVSTDSAEIAEVARAAGASVPFLRPEVHSRDEAPAIDVVLHAVERLSVNLPWAVVLQPTSPLRSATDIVSARALAESRDANAVISVTAVRQHTAWQKRLCAEGWVCETRDAPTTRQALPQAVVPNGAIYLCRTNALIKHKTLTPPRTAAYEMPGSCSVDIDVPDDLVIAEALMERRNAGVLLRDR